MSTWFIRLSSAVLLAPVLRPGRAAVRGWSLAAVVANAVIISTGAAVRLSSSGLGCPDWPRCPQSSVVAAHAAGQTTLNTWIEFGNRLLNFPLAAIAGLTFIACLCYRENGQCYGENLCHRGKGRRRDLMWLSAALPAGVIAQAVVGGIVVLTRLNPALVAAHFLLSSALILTAAVVLHVRAGEGSGPARPLVRADLRVMSGLLVAVTALMLAAGTVVTGTGPLAGTTVDDHGHLSTVPRFRLPLTGVTQFHADIGWFISALAVAVAIGLWFAAGAPAAARRNSLIVAGGVVVQGLIGYLQYANHLPAGLVWVHVSGAVVLWIFVLRLYLSTRERIPASASEPAGPDPAVTVGSYRAKR
ncbi:MAG: heme A synthase [Nocardiopsaceae bacterium]|nr:heme A synthase [Nocardiopsaceae bacterium]